MRDKFLRIPTLAGLFVLLFALVVAVWGRSGHHPNAIAVYSRAGVLNGIAADQKGILFFFSDIPFGLQKGLHIEWAPVSSDEVSPLLFDPAHEKWKRLGFHFAEGIVPTWTWHFSATIVPYWAILLALSIFPLRSAYRLGRYWTRGKRGQCRTCGYDLRASAGRCPECGTSVRGAENAAGISLPRLRLSNARLVLRLLPLLVLGAVVVAIAEARARVHGVGNERELLNQPVNELSLNEVPLTDAAIALQAACGVPLHIQPSIFSDSGNSPIQIRLRQVTRAVAIRAVLTYPAPLSFSRPQMWMTADGGIGIGGDYAAPFEVRIYPIGDLIDAFAMPDDSEFIEEAHVFHIAPALPRHVQMAIELADVVAKASRFDGYGSAGRLEAIGDRLVVYQSPQVQAVIARVLNALRTAGPEGGPPVDAPPPAPEIPANLDQPISRLPAVLTTFGSGVDALRVSTTANMLVYWNDLGEAGIAQDTPVQLHFHDTTLRKAIGDLIASVKPSHPLMFDVHDNIIRLGSAQRLLNDPEEIIAVYDVRDVVKGVIDEFSRREGEQLARNLQLPRTEGQWVGVVGITEEAAERGITDFIEKRVFPETWKANGGSSGIIDSLHGRMIVVQTPEAHRRIRDLLRSIRRGREVDLERTIEPPPLPLRP